MDKLVEHEWAAEMTDNMIHSTNEDVKIRRAMYWTLRRIENLLIKGSRPAPQVHTDVVKPMPRLKGKVKEAIKL